MQNPQLDFEALYRQAEQSMPQLDAFGQEFVEHLKHKYPEQFDGVYFEQGDLKALERARAKIDADYFGDHTKIADLIRGRVVVDNPSQIQIIRSEFAAFREQFSIEKANDFYARPLDSHFRTINAKIRLATGHVAEFRVDQLDMIEAGDIAHKSYEEMQVIERRAAAENRSFTPEEQQRWQELLEEQRVTLDRAAHKANLDSLLNEDGKHLLESHRMERAEGFETTFKKFGQNGGLITGIAVGGLTAAFTLASGADTAEAAEVFYETAVPYGETQLDLAHGDVEAARRSATIETASNIGSVGGTLAFAATGAALGSVVPVIGTGIGAVAFGLIGAFGGGMGAAYLTELVYDNFNDAKDKKPHVAAGDAEQLHARATVTARLIADNDNCTPENYLTRHTISDIRITDEMPPELQHLIETERLLTQAEMRDDPDTLKTAEERYAEARQAVLESEFMPDIMKYVQCHQQDISLKQEMPDNIQTAGVSYTTDRQMAASL